MEAKTLFNKLDEVLKEVEDLLMQEVEDKDYHKELLTFLLGSHSYDVLFQKHHLEGNPSIYKRCLLVHMISDFYIMVFYKQARRIPVDTKEYRLFGELASIKKGQLFLWAESHAFDGTLEYILTNYLERKEGCLFENALTEGYHAAARKREMDYLIRHKSKILSNLFSYYPLFYQDVVSLPDDFEDQVLTDLTQFHVDFLHLLVAELEEDEELCGHIRENYSDEPVIEEETIDEHYSEVEEEELEDFEETSESSLDEREEENDFVHEKLMNLCVELEDIDDEEVFLEANPIGEETYSHVLEQVKNNLIRVRDSYVAYLKLSKEDPVQRFSYVLANVYVGLCSEVAPLSDNQKNVVLYLEQLSMTNGKAVQEFLENDLFAFYILRYFFYYNIKLDRNLRAQRENKLDPASKKVLMKLYDCNKNK